MLFSIDTYIYVGISKVPNSIFIMFLIYFHCQYKNTRTSISLKPRVSTLCTVNLNNACINSFTRDFFDLKLEVLHKHQTCP